MDVFNHHKVDFRTDHGIPWLGILFALLFLSWWLDGIRVDHWRADCRKDSVLAGLSDADIERACYLPEGQ